MQILCRRFIKRKNFPPLNMQSLYLRNSSLLNNLISHFRSPGKFLLVLCGPALGSSPPSTLSIPSSLCVVPQLCFPRPVGASDRSRHTVLPRSQAHMLYLCLRLWARQETRVSFVHHHIPCTQDSSWYNKCLLNK